MLYPELLTCSLIVIIAVSGQRNSKSIDAQPRLGYSTSILHSIPGLKDANAQSSVNFNFQSGENRGRYTKTISNAPSSKIFTRTSLSGDSNNPNSFNVGYNLTFNDNSFNVRKTEPRHTEYVNNKKFDNAEVITGRSKKNEKVRAPSINNDLSAKDFVVSALSKKHSARVFSSTGTISPVREQIPKYFSTFPKPDEPIQRSPEYKTAFEASGRRRKFKRVPENNVQVETNSARSFAQNFNHEAALRNGQIFNFNDVHEGNSFESTKVADNFPAGSELFSQKANVDDVRPSAVDGIHGSPQAFEINKINIEAHIPKNLRGVKPLPIDTSLLKDPVLTTSYKEVGQNPKVIPIHFDIRQIQNIMQQELSKPQVFAAPQKPLQQNLADSSNVVAMDASLDYENHGSSHSQADFRLYGKTEAVDKGKYRMGSEYGKGQANYDEDIYKILSLRPPPIGQSMVY